MLFGTEKLEWCGYRRWKKFEDTFIRFDRMYERDGHTHTDGQTPHDDIGRACTASRGKNRNCRRISGRSLLDGHLWAQMGWSTIAYRTWADDRVGSVNNIHWSMARPRVSGYCLYRKPTKLRWRQIVQKTFWPPIWRPLKISPPKGGETMSGIELYNHAKFTPIAFIAPEISVLGQTNTSHSIRQNAQ